MVGIRNEDIRGEDVFDVLEMKPETEMFGCVQRRDSEYLGWKWRSGGREEDHKGGLRTE